MVNFHLRHSGNFRTQIDNSLFASVQYKELKSDRETYTQTEYRDRTKSLRATAAEVRDQRVKAALFSPAQACERMATWLIESSQQSSATAGPTESAVSGNESYVVRTNAIDVQIESARRRFGVRPQSCENGDLAPDGMAAVNQSLRPIATN